MKKYTLPFLLILLPSLTFAQQSGIDSLLNIVNKHTHDSVEVRTLCLLGFEAAKRDPVKAQFYYQEAIQVSEKYALGPWKGIAYLRMASLYGSQGKNDSAKVYLNQAEDVLNRYPNDTDLRLDFYSKAGVFNRNIGQYDEALKFYNLISTTGESVTGKEVMAGNYLNMANLYRTLGKSSLTQEYLFKALALFEEIKNETGISFCYNGLGNEFYRQKNTIKPKSICLCPWH